MEFLRQLFHGKGYIDGITIINLDGEILFSAKLNSKFSNRKEREAYQALVGQNFFDVFENLNAKNSSMIRAMEVGLPVYVENQLLQTKGQEGIHISSLSIPIKSGRAVVGAIDPGDGGDDRRRGRAGECGTDFGTDPGRRRWKAEKTQRRIFYDGRYHRSG